MARTFSTMKRVRSAEAVKETLHQLLSLQTIPRDVLHERILMLRGLDVRDVNNLCNSSPFFRDRCRDGFLWEKIYLKYVPGADVAAWRASQNMPNHFLRFMSFHALSDGWHYKFTSPSGAEAIILNDPAIIRPQHPMPEGYQAQWEARWLADNEDIGDSSDENNEEYAEMAFSEAFSDENGYQWDYITYGSEEALGAEITHLIAMHIVTRVPDGLAPVTSMQHVFYSLMSLGWKPLYHPKYPTLDCRVCNSNITAATMCSHCKVPICGMVCFDGHFC